MTTVTGSDRKLATGAALVAGLLVAVVVILGFVATQTDDDLRQRTLRWMAALVAVVAVVAVANAVAARALVDRPAWGSVTGRAGVVVGLAVAVASLLLPRPGAYVALQILCALLTAWTAVFGLAVLRAADSKG
jgi:hypothetical protein